MEDSLHGGVVLRDASVAVVANSTFACREVANPPPARRLRPLPAFPVVARFAAAELARPVWPAWASIDFY